MPLLFAHEESELLNLSKVAKYSGDGAHVVFTGTVRDFNKSKPVSHLFYEAYEDLARKQFAKLEETARLRFGMSSSIAVHRVGRAKVGECTVIIKASAPHRHEAFLAARFLIDELKKSVPIWKQENYRDGSFTWDKGLCQCDESFDPELDPALEPVKKAYKSQSLDFQKLRKSRVLLVGAGGLGCPMALNLAALGLGYLEIYDGDSVSPSNLARQFIYNRSHIGINKALVIKNFLEERFSWTKILAHEKLLSKSQAEKSALGFDLIIDSSDCMKTKIMLGEVCRQAGVPFLCASVYSQEGEVALLSPWAQGGCFCCWRQSLEQPTTCAESGVFTHACALVAAHACAQAQLVLADPHQIKFNELTLITTQKAYQKIVLTKDPNCRACGQGSLRPVFNIIPRRDCAGPT